MAHWLENLPAVAEIIARPCFHDYKAPELVVCYFPVGHSREIATIKIRCLPSILNLEHRKHLTWSVQNGSNGGMRLFTLPGTKNFSRLYLIILNSSIIG